MVKNIRYLITCDDEKTWKFDRPVIFLGEWCRRYDRQHVWQKMDAIVAEPYGLGLAQKDKDNAEARALEEKIFPALYASLNEYHGTHHGERFWRIVLGHWFRRYVNVLLNRVKTMEKCLAMHRIEGMTGYSNASLTTKDSYTAIWAFNDERWNNELNLQILKLLGGEKYTFEYLKTDQKVEYSWVPKSLHYTENQNVWRWIYKKTGKLLTHVAKNNDAFIISSYLPKKEVIKLSLNIGQSPQLWKSPEFKTKKNPDPILRAELAKKIQSETKIQQEKIIRALVFELLPICYLEAFKDLKKCAQSQRWPRNPKFIMTSNNFDTDEVFKLWTAEKIESGSKYIVGQHGNSYGTSRYMSPAIEEETADKFLTWGWTDGLPQHTPAFMFKTAGEKLLQHNPQGGLLLIQIYLTHRIHTWDSSAEYIKYFEEQQTLLKIIHNSIKEKVTIRLHAGYQYQNKWSDELRWKDFNPSLRIDKGQTPINSLIKQSRLVVHSYDSTGILETLSHNIPTLAFWQNGFDHLRESAKPYYQLLVEAEIVHLSPESIARHIIKIWDDVEGWWKQEHIQKIRSEFCNRYARTTKSPISELKKILTVESQNDSFMIKKQ